MKSFDLKSRTIALQRVPFLAWYCILITDKVISIARKIIRKKTNGLKILAVF